LEFSELKSFFAVFPFKSGEEPPEYEEGAEWDIALAALEDTQEDTWEEVDDALYADLITIDEYEELSKVAAAVKVEVQEHHVHDPPG
jgi:hypothetical protein